jgi:hypothetical protein
MTVLDRDTAAVTLEALERGDETRNFAAIPVTGWKCAGSYRCEVIVDVEGAMCLRCETDAWDALNDARLEAQYG